MQNFVSLIFDDGWKSAYTEVSPILDRYNVRATFYIVSNYLADKYKNHMSPKELHHLYSAGHEIGSHTRSHMRLTNLPEKDTGDEIAQGVNELLALGFLPRTFAYPFGSWNLFSRKHLMAAGCVAARSIVRGANDAHTDPFLLKTYRVRAENSAKDVISWIKGALSEKPWVTLTFHQVEKRSVLIARGWTLGTTPEVLNEILAFLKSEAIEILTVYQGNARVREF